ncbi:hypothetical protein [Roseibium limicola]|nr:hypothetical protein [Roseibium limicola]
MLQDPARHDVLSARRASPWPMVIAIIGCIGFLSILVSAFNG